MEEPEVKHKRSVLGLVILSIIVILVISSLTAAYLFWRTVFRPNVRTTDGNIAYVCIPTGSDFDRVKSIFYERHLISHPRSFEWVAKWKKYDGRVRPGRYRILPGMSNNQLVNELRSGRQSPVRLVFNSILTKQDLAEKVSQQIEADSVTLLGMLNDPALLNKYGLRPATAFVLFIPNTYEFFWNTSPVQFFDRMSREQKKFWNPERRQKCRDQGLTITQAVTLASIVERETSRDAEKPLIAGVYLNRLKKNWPLQADPTLIFALNDYTIHRVLDKHKEVNSPYNTYLHTGLPPGPICLPSIASIDAVLNPQGSGYLYFCAKDDLSGFHVFETTLAEHARNAKKYQEALSKLERQKKNEN